jgi:hypothetical protein
MVSGFGPQSIYLSSWFIYFSFPYLSLQAGLTRKVLNNLPDQKLRIIKAHEVIEANNEPVSTRGLVR